MKKTIIDWANILKYIMPIKPTIGEPLIVFHYTNYDSAVSITNGFKNIKNKSEFYHKRYDSFLDKTEGTEIDEFYKKALELIHQNYHIDNKLYLLLSSIKSDDCFQIYLDEEDADGNKYTSVKTIKLVPYICCFSKKKDDLKMWEEYLKGSPDGFSIGITVTDLKEEECRAFGNGYSHIILNVIYKNEEKIKLIYNFLKKVITDNADTKLIKYYVTKFLNINRFRFKNKDYDYEEEIRSVIYIRDGDNQFEYKDNKKIIIFSLESTPITEMVYYGEKTPLIDQIDCCCHYSECYRE